MTDFVTPDRGMRPTPRIAPGALAAKLRRLQNNAVSPSPGTVEDILECLDALAWYDDHCRADGSYEGEMFGHLTESKVTL